MRAFVIGIIVLFGFGLTALIGALKGVAAVSEWERALEDEEQVRAIEEYMAQKASRKEARRETLRKITSRIRR